MKHTFIAPLLLVAVGAVTRATYVSVDAEKALDVPFITLPIETIQSVLQINTGHYRASFIDTEGVAIPEIIVDEEAIQNMPSNDVQPSDFATADSLSRQLQEQSPEEAVLENTLPAQVHLDVPFYAQSPDGSWTLPRKEACEEASITLAAYFLKQEELSLVQFEQEVLALVALQEDMFGDYIDTNVEQTAALYEAYFGIGETLILDDPTLDNLKYHLAQGHPIIAPFAGKKLGNSYFANGGPRYHMLVIIGYDETYFYTNDVGTSRGADFPYTHEVIMDALHDLVPLGEGDMIEGAKRVLVLSQ